MADEHRDDDINEIRRTIRAQQAKLRAQLLTSERAKLADHWAAVERAHERTDDASELAESGMGREYFLQAIDDMAVVRREAEASLRELANLLVQDLDVPSTTVAQTVGVSHTTIYRWLDPDRKTPGE